MSCCRIFSCCCGKNDSEKRENELKSQNSGYVLNRLLPNTPNSNSNLELTGITTQNVLTNQKYVVQFSYANLTKGMHVEEIQATERNEHPNWINVRDPNGEIIRVPLGCLAKLCDIKEEPWYFMNINSRDHAELILKNADPETGIYLIRKCSMDNVPFVLSVKQSKITEAGEHVFWIEHFQIFEKDGQFGQKDEELFVTLGAMIDEYTKAGVLSRPCPRNQIVNISPDEIQLVKEIGSGAFGTVSKARWKNQFVAVKHITRQADFTTEIQQICQFNHPKIVTIYGANINNSPHFMVMEYMCNDTLHKFVHNNNLSLYEQFYILEQICDGMRFLEKYKVIHRKLSANEVLMGDDLCAKIADFGLSRNLKPDDVYYRSTKNRFPYLFWLAVESVQHHKFTVKSDVWMFGILAIEVFTRGEKPYKEFPDVNMQNFAQKLAEGVRMSRPEEMPENVYNIVKTCWDAEPNKRPSFGDLYEYFIALKERAWVRFTHKP